jgi:hypothetical protein
MATLPSPSFGFVRMSVSQTPSICTLATSPEPRRHQNVEAQRRRFSHRLHRKHTHFSRPFSNRCYSALASRLGTRGYPQLARSRRLGCSSQSFWHRVIYFGNFRTLFSCTEQYGGDEPTRTREKRQSTSYPTPSSNSSFSSIYQPSHTDETYLTLKNWNI